MSALKNVLEGYKGKQPPDELVDFALLEDLAKIPDYLRRITIALETLAKRKD